MHEGVRQDALVRRGARLAEVRREFEFSSAFTYVVSLRGNRPVSYAGHLGVEAPRHRADAVSVDVDFHTVANQSFETKIVSSFN